MSSYFGNGEEQPLDAEHARTHRIAQARQLLRCYAEAAGQAPRDAAAVIAWADSSRGSLPTRDGQIIPLYDPVQVAGDELSESVVQILEERLLDEYGDRHRWASLGRHAVALIEDERIVAVVYWTTGDVVDEESPSDDSGICEAGWYLVETGRPDEHECLAEGSLDLWSDALKTAEEIWLARRTPGAR
jgi:hypothetical protein